MNFYKNTQNTLKTLENDKKKLKEEKESRFLPDDKTCGTSTEKVKFTPECREKM